MTKLSLFIIFSICSIIFISCQDTPSETKESVDYSKVELNDHVVIQGTTNDTTLSWLSIGTNSTLFGDPLISAKIVDNSFSMTFLQKKPQTHWLHSVGGVYFAEYVFITPGDSIFAKLNNGKPEFEGKNAAHYNFNFQLKNLGLEWPIYSNNIIAHKNACKEIYDEKKQFLQRYIKINSNVSPDFINFTEAELKYEYLHHLMNPRVGENGYQSQEPIFQIANKELDKFGKSFNAKDYFDGVTLEDYQHPAYVDNYFFKPL